MTVGVLGYIISSFATAVVAVVAIVVGRRSSRDMLRNELRQRMWEKRTDAYIDMLREIKRFDPREITPHTIAEQGASGEPVPILPQLETAEWLEFTARVEAVASEEVRSLFNLWERCLAGWSWIVSMALVHFDEPGSKVTTKIKKDWTMYMRQYLQRAICS